jgi:protein-disulfide isomerase
MPKSIFKGEWDYSPGGMVSRRATAQLGAVLVVAALVVVGAILLSGGDDTKPAASQAPTQAQAVDKLYAGIPQDGIHLGRRDAAATLVEIADLQCPFCAEYSTTALPTIVRDYVRTGRIRYELRIRSFLGRDSVRAAGAAAYAAQEDRMYQFVDTFYRNQGPEGSGYADSDFIRRIAAQVPGLDPEKAVAAANAPLAQPLVRAGERFARNLGSTGTPDFYVRKGGRLQPLRPEGGAPEDYTRALDAVLQ